MGFTDSAGWRKVTSTGGANPIYTQDELVPYVDAKNVKSYLFIPATTGSTTTDWIFNMSIRSSRNFVQRFIYGESYILRMKVESKAQGASTYSAVSPPFTQIKIAKYLSSDNYYPSDAANETYFEIPNGSSWTADGSTGYYYIRLNCVNGLSLESVSDAKIGLYFKNDTISGGYPKIRIEEAQLFKEIRTDDGSDFIRPAEFDAAGVLKTQYYLYDNTAAKAQGFTSKDQIIPLYCGDNMISTDDTRYKYITTEFKKFRTITGKESNRFNLLQSLAEKFECWCVIYANHSANGTITSRHVKFVETVGEDQNIGFIYGLDLKGIKRTVDSKQIVTKTIVKTNSNKYGENGFATIARAQENYPKVNYVLDFDYYVNQGLLDNSALNQALYSVATDTSQMPGTSQQWPANTPVGYYQKLHKFNTAYDNAANSYEKYKLQYDNLGAYLKVFEEYQENAKTEKYGYMLSLFNLGNFIPGDEYDSTAMENTLNDYWNYATASIAPASGTDARKIYDWYQANVVASRAQDGLRDQAAVTAWKYSDAIVAAIANEDKYTDQIESISDTIDELADNIEDAEDEMEAQVTLIHAADLQF